VPLGQAISQDPLPGAKVDRGTTVSVIFSLGKDRVPIPDVRRKTVADASKILSDGRLQLGGPSPTYHNTVPEGQIIDQNPGPNPERVAVPGTTVNVTVSRGPEPVCVDVVGMTQSNAEKRLESAGLKASVTLVDSKTVDRGRVISQSPDCAPPGRTITLRVANGVVVPNVVGQAEASATSALEAAGLRVKVATGPCDNGDDVYVVIAQDPKAETRVDRNSEVTITGERDCGSVE
jgi:serine/threonine-protein kinase